MNRRDILRAGVTTGVRRLAHRTLTARDQVLHMAGPYLGAVSAVFELGLTWLAERWWRLLGHDPGRAVAVAAGGAVAGEERGELLARAAAAPLFWLAPPAERGIDLLASISTEGFWPPN